MKPTINNLEKPLALQEGDIIKYNGDYYSIDAVDENISYDVTCLCDDGDESILTGISQNAPFTFISHAPKFKKGQVIQDKDGNTMYIEKVGIHSYVTDEGSIPFADQDDYNIVVDEPLVSEDCKFNNGDIVWNKDDHGEIYMYTTNISEYGYNAYAVDAYNATINVDDFEVADEAAAYNFNREMYDNGWEWSNMEQDIVPVNKDVEDAPVETSSNEQTETKCKDANDTDAAEKEECPLMEDRLKNTQSILGELFTTPNESFLMSFADIPFESFDLIVNASNDSEENYPVWTVTSLMDLIPAVIKTNGKVYTFSMTKNATNQYVFAYIEKHSGDKAVCKLTADSLMEGAVGFIAKMKQFYPSAIEWNFKKK